MQGIACPLGVLFLGYGYLRVRSFYTDLSCVELYQRKKELNRQGCGRIPSGGSYISEILPVEPGDFHICPRSGNVSARTPNGCQESGAAPCKGRCSYAMAWSTSAHRSRVVRSVSQVMMVVSKEAFYETKLFSRSYFTGCSRSSCALVKVPRKR